MEYTTIDMGYRTNKIRTNLGWVLYYTWVMGRSKKGYGMLPEKNQLSSGDYHHPCPAQLDHSHRQVGQSAGDGIRLTTSCFFCE